MLHGMTLRIYQSGGETGLLQAYGFLGVERMSMCGRVHVSICSLPGIETGRRCVVGRSLV